MFEKKPRRERTLRQSVENALRLSEQRFQYAAAATREIIWDWDLTTDRIWFNDALRDFWGHVLPHPEVELSWFRQHVHAEDESEVMASLRAALVDAEHWTAEFRFARADDSFSHVYGRGLIVRDSGGRPLRVIGAFFDLTERLQLEQARRVESLSRVAATIAHEFNNVLMGILPMAALLRKRAAADPGIERIASQIAASVSRGRRMTDQILRFATPAEPAFDQVDLSSWIEQFTSELRSLLGQRVALRVSTASTGLRVRMDSSQMQQVLSNLVVNARDSMPNGGTVYVTAEPAGDMVALSVGDEGTGIAPSIRERIFEPLFTTKRSGTGLGLAVAQQIIASHGGSIQVRSTCGVGTTFTILLPEVETLM